MNIWRFQLAKTFTTACAAVILSTSVAFAQQGTPQAWSPQQMQGTADSANQAVAAQPAQAANAPSGSQGFILKGGVEHSAAVQPLPPQYLPGQRFNANAIVSAPPVDEWICIPPWIAGTFVVQQSLIVSYLDYKSGQQMAPNKLEKIYRTFDYGHQLDSSGRVWHLNRCPYRNSIDTERSVQYNLINISRFLHSGNDSVVETATGPALVVAKDNGVIVRANQLETLGKFQYDGQSIIKTTSIKAFDATGRPVDLIVRVERANMQKPFVPDPSTSESFRRFMEARAAQRAN